MSLLMQALRRAETAKKNQDGPGSPAAAASDAMPAAAAASAEMTLELKEPTADEIAAVAEGERQAALAAEARAEAAFAGFDKAPSAAPVDYFGGAEPPARAPYVPPAPQGFDPERGAGAVSAPAPPAAAAPPVPEAAAPRPAQPAPAETAPQAAAARSAARGVFAAKQQVRSRRPWIIAAVGSLVLAAAAAIFYFQFLRLASPLPYQQQPYPQGAAAVLVPAAAPVAPGVEGPVAAVGAATPVAPAPAAGPSAPIFAPAVPAAPAAAVRVPRAAQPARTVASSEADAMPAPALASTVRAVRAARAEAGAAAPQIEVRRVPATHTVNPTLTAAYQAFVAGDPVAARSAYQRVLQQDPDNRDALLGMAAIAANRGQDGEAGAFYTRLLALDPVDTQAAAGMAALQRGDPDQAESRLKGVLAASPENGAALFALGNVYAQQARWPEAQLAYFRAVGSEPANAGYAFNLAVSLDKLNQKKLALDYYRRALQLAAKGGATVDAATTERRIRQLEQGVAPR